MEPHGSESAETYKEISGDPSTKRHEQDADAANNDPCGLLGEIVAE